MNKNNDIILLEFILMDIQSIFDNIGGFLLSPKNQTLKLLTKKDREWNSIIIQAIILIAGSSVFAGTVLMFFMMYPEVFFVPNTEHTGQLFIYAAAHPIFIIALFGLGMILVLVLDILIQGSLSYLVIKRTLKFSPSSPQLSYGRFIAMYSFSLVYIDIFYIITVFWMFFFEKFSYTKIFFPVTDLTLPVIIHFSILFILIIMKWIFEIRMKLGIFQWAEVKSMEMNESIIVSLCIKLWIFAVIIMVFYFSGNLIAGAQWS
jgi:hypothetical protein